MPGPEAPAAAPMVKGRALLDTVGVIRDRFGEAALQKAIAGLDPAARQVLGGRLLVSEWYPLDAMTALMAGSLALNEGGDESRVIRRSEEVVARQLGGVYSLFVRLGSPEWIVKRITAVNEAYFRNVHISQSFVGERKATVRYVGFQPQHRILELAIVGFYRKALELSGAKDREVRFTTSVTDGKGFSELELSWS
jgi:alkanesulfonate monooxygenase SsuD/methylene tetrahydromethanopterin reductase-like flavin-dependent oxidoreductase (luciferase family)